MSSLLKKLSNIVNKIKKDLKNNKKRSKNLFHDMEQKLEKESRFRLLFAALIVILVIINPLLIPLIAGLGFIGSIISSIIGSLTFLSALEPLYSGILTRLVKKPISFFIIGLFSLIIGLESIYSSFNMGLTLENSLSGLLKLGVASLFFHYFLKYNNAPDLKTKKS
ncbi:hypothetical protein HYG87_05655 [Methanobacterium alkalithermotolerans]|uniref:Uncharacterized protein n=1 Tax=Methanobacterium alkalithermotolerans TaxID=2731220 RepID=A0A8T8KD41_9EURY|nr:hypothetical protein [Methanobacterium alkalithermotolerans]QUH23281.1 hypothetical protein HYG87_05655 [Methanobacterium alkalithermotolerans]